MHTHTHRHAHVHTAAVVAFSCAANIPPESAQSHHREWEGGETTRGAVITVDTHLCDPPCYLRPLPKSLSVGIHRSPCATQRERERKREEDLLTHSEVFVNHLDRCLALQSNACIRRDVVLLRRSRALKQKGQGKGRKEGGKKRGEENLQRHASGALSSTFCFL